MSERPLCLCESYARVTERAALAGARWLGRADVEGAEEATFSAMRGSLDELPINGRIVIGAPEGEGLLPVGATVGAGGEVRTGEMRQRRQREIAIADFEAGRGLAQPFDDGGGNLAADGVGAENAGVDVQKFHG